MIKKKRIVDIIICCGLFSAILGLVMFPSDMVGAASDGVELCLQVIIPSLFPFFVLSSLIVRLGVAGKIGRIMSPVMRPLFNVSGSCASALVLGSIGGYPVGARTIVNLYNEKGCTKEDAQRMLAFCNNSGPAFIFGIVGSGLFGNGKIGLMLYVIHILSAVLVGVFFRFTGGKASSAYSVASSDSAEAFPVAFTKSVSTSFTSCIGLCGFVIFFTVFIKLLDISGIIGAISNVFSVFTADSIFVESILTGIVELTGGIYGLAGASLGTGSLIAACAFMLGWGGLSVHFQTLSLLEGTDLSSKSYFTGKLMQGVISAFLTLLVTAVLPSDSVISAAFIQSAGPDRVSPVKISLCLFIICSIAAFISSKKGGKSHGKAL